MLGAVACQQSRAWAPDPIDPWKPRCAPLSGQGSRYIKPKPDVPVPRTCPVGLLFRVLHAQLGGSAKRMDVMIVESGTIKRSFFPRKESAGKASAMRRLTSSGVIREGAEAV